MSTATRSPGKPTAYRRWMSSRGFRNESNHSTKASLDTNDTSSETSSIKGNNSLHDYSLPAWENPLALQEGAKKPAIPDPQRVPVPPPSRSRSSRIFLKEQPVPSLLSTPATDTREHGFENMIVTCHPSEASFDDELTLGESDFTDSPSGRQSQSNHRQMDRHPQQQNVSNNRTLSRPNVNSTGARYRVPMASPHEQKQAKSTDCSLDTATAESLQEEEMLLLALERSLQDAPPPARPTSRQPPMARSNNNHAVTPPYLMSVDFSQPPPSTVQTDASTGARFIWQKGPNNRYIKAFIPDNYVDGVADVNTGYQSTARFASSSSSSRPEVVRRDEAEAQRRIRIDNEMRNNAMRIPLKADTPAARPPPPSMPPMNNREKTDAEREEEMIALAIQESLRESERGNNNAQQLYSTNSFSQSSVPSRSSGNRFAPTITTASNYTSTPRPMSIPLNDTRPMSVPLNDTRPMSVPLNDNTSSLQGPPFIWKKGPNNRYYKCYLGSDDYNNGNGNEFDSSATRSSSGMGGARQQESNEERLRRMEQELLDEALARSLENM